MVRPARSERRGDALTRERIVETAIELLDAGGESGLTFRALAVRLGTGHGAIQWHIGTKGELLTAACSRAVSRALPHGADADPPRTVLRAIALGVFDAIERHPWVGPQLARPPWHDTMLDLFELLGRQVQALGVPTDQHFTAASTLLNHIIGAGTQQATNGTAPEASRGRREFLDQVADHWAELDPRSYGFTRTVADQLRAHDDRAEFLAGVDLIIGGLVTSR